MNKKIRWVLLILFFLGLVAVRAFQEFLFYDPLHVYFQNEYLYSSFPEVDVLKLFGSYSFRYFLNGLISFLILKTAFPQQSFFRTVAAFYTLAFVVLSLVFFGLLSVNIDFGYLFPFMIRRFIIHPVFIIILLPFLYLLRKRYRLNLK